MTVTPFCIKIYLFIELYKYCINNIKWHINIFYDRSFLIIFKEINKISFL